MEDTSQEIQDPSEEGIGGIKGLSGVSSKKPKVVPHQYNQSKIDALKEKGYDTTLLEKHNRGFAQSMEQDIENSSPTVAIGNADYGKSSFDMQASLPSQLENLNDTRGELQPAWMQLGAGIAKAGVIAGTTFADGVAGTYIGLLNVGLNTDEIANSTHPWATALNKFINNPLSRALQEINEKTEEIIPNYMTDEQNATPWYERLLDANTISNTFLKTFGFMAGAAMSASVNAGSLSKILGMKEAKNVFKGAVEEATNSSLKSAKAFENAVNDFSKGKIKLSSADMAKSLMDKAKDLKSKDMLLRWEGAITSAAGEARLEAIGDTKQWLDNLLERAKGERDEALASIDDRIREEHPDWFSTVRDDEMGTLKTTLTDPRGLQLRQQYMDQINSRYNQIAKMAADKGVYMSNQIFGLNLAFLTVDNVLQMGRFISGGYASGVNFKRLVKEDLKTATSPSVAAKAQLENTAERTARKAAAEQSANIFETAGENMRGFTKNKAIINRMKLRAAANPFVEANEEMAQAAIQESTGHKHSSELNEYFNAQIDPSASKKTESWASSIWEGLKNTYGNANQWEQGFAGFVTGLFGMPMISMDKTRTGVKKYIPKVSFNSELWEGFKDAKAANGEAEELVEELNKRIRNPKFVELYKGLTAHNYFQEQKENSLDDNDAKAFKDADYKQFLSDALMFDKAGMLEDFKDLIDMGAKANIKDIDTVKQLSLDPLTGKSVFDGAANDDEIIAKIQKQAKEAVNRVNTYTKISDSLKTLYGDKLDRNQISELIWNVANIDDQQNRFKELLNDKDLHSDLVTLIEEQQKDLAKDTMENVNKSISESKDEHKPEPMTAERANEAVSQILEAFKSGDTDKLFKAYSSEDVMNVLGTLSERVVNMQDDPKKNSNIVLLENLLNQINDLGRLYTTRQELIGKFNLMSAHPEMFTEAAQNKLRELKETKINENIESSVKLFDNVNTVEEFNNVLEHNVDPEIRDRVVERLNNSPNEKIKNLSKATSEFTNALETMYKEVNNMQTSNQIPNDPEFRDTFAESFYQAAQHANSAEDLINILRSLAGKDSRLKDSVKGALNHLADTIDTRKTEAASLLNAVSKTSSAQSAAAQSPSSGTEVNIGAVMAAKPSSINIANPAVNVPSILSNNDTNTEKVDKVYEAITNTSETDSDKNISPVSDSDKEAAIKAATSALGNLEEAKKYKDNDPDATKEDKEYIDNATKELKDKLSIIGSVDGGYSNTDLEHSNLKSQMNAMTEDNTGYRAEDNLLSRPANNIIGMHFRNGPTLYDYNKLSAGELSEGINGNLTDIVGALKKLGVYDFINHGNLGRILNAEKSMTVHFIVSNEMTDISLMGKDYWAMYKEQKNLDGVDSVGPVIFMAISKEDIDSYVNKGIINSKEFTAIKDKNGSEFVIIGVVSPYRSYNYSGEGKDKKIVSFTNEALDSIEQYIKFRNKLTDEATGILANESIAVKETQTITRDMLYSGRLVRQKQGDNGTRIHPLTKESFNNGLYSNPPLFMAVYKNGFVKYSDDTTNKHIVALNRFRSENRNGTIWVYTMEADGNYYPKALFTRRFGEALVGQTPNTNTKIYNEIRKAIETIVDISKPRLERIAAKRELHKWLYLNKDSDILFRNDSDIITVGRQYDVCRGLESVAERTEKVLEVLTNIHPRYRICVDKLNPRVENGDYYNMIMEENILQTDLAFLYNVNAGFDIPIPGHEGEYTSKPEYVSTGERLHNTTIILDGTTYETDGTMVKLNGEVLGAGKNDTIQKVLDIHHILNDKTYKVTISGIEYYKIDQNRVYKKVAGKFYRETGTTIIDTINKAIADKLAEKNGTKKLDDTQSDKLRSAFSTTPTTALPASDTSAAPVAPSATQAPLPETTNEPPAVIPDKGAPEEQPADDNGILPEETATDLSKLTLFKDIDISGLSKFEDIQNQSAGPNAPAAQPVPEGTKEVVSMDSRDDDAYNVYLDTMPEGAGASMTNLGNTIDSPLVTNVNDINKKLGDKFKTVPPKIDSNTTQQDMNDIGNTVQDCK